MMYCMMQWRKECSVYKYVETFLFITKQSKSTTNLHKSRLHFTNESNFQSLQSVNRDSERTLTLKWNSSEVFSITIRYGVKQVP